jgi:hypothetical protein
LYSTMIFHIFIFLKGRLHYIVFSEFFQILRRCFSIIFTKIFYFCTTIPTISCYYSTKTCSRIVSIFANNLVTYMHG